MSGNKHAGREGKKKKQPLVSPRDSYCQFFEPFNTKFSVKHFACFWVTVKKRQKKKRGKKK